MSESYDVHSLMFFYLSSYIIIMHDFTEKGVLMDPGMVEPWLHEEMVLRRIKWGYRGKFPKYNWNTLGK